MSINGINGLPEQTSKEEVGKCSFLIFIYIASLVRNKHLSLTNHVYNIRYIDVSAVSHSEFPILTIAALGWGGEWSSYNKRHLLTVQWNSLLNDPEF